MGIWREWIWVSKTHLSTFPWYAFASAKSKVLLPYKGLMPSSGLSWYLCALAMDMLSYLATDTGVHLPVRRDHLLRHPLFSHRMYISRWRWCLLSYLVPVKEQLTDSQYHPYRAPHHAVPMGPSANGNICKHIVTSRVSSNVTAAFESLLLLN